MAKHTEQGKRTGRGSRQFYSVPFIGVPKALASDPTITPPAKVLWMAIVLLAWDEKHDPNDREANGVTFVQLAGVVGVSEPTLRKARAELQDRGWARYWKRGQGLADGYESFVKPSSQTERIFGGTPKESFGPRASATMDVNQELEEEQERTLAPAARKRDLPFDAMAEVTDSDPQLEGSAIAKAVNQLRKHVGYVEYAEQYGREKAEATLALAIQRQSENYAEHFPGMSLTPSALVRHWKRIRKPKDDGRGLTPEQMMQRAREEKGA